MLNTIWMGMMVVAVITGIFQGRLDLVTKAVTDSATTGFQIALGLAGIMTLWLGVMNVAAESGLVKLFARMVKPIMRWLFPDVPEEHPAMGAMVMNIAANMLGLGNAATPFGLEAMHKLQSLNKFPDTATNAMCTFLTLNTSSVQLIPATVITLLAASGNPQPTAIILSSLLATSFSTLVGIVAVKSLARLPGFRLGNNKVKNSRVKII